MLSCEKWEKQHVLIDKGHIGYKIGENKKELLLERFFKLQVIVMSSLDTNISLG